MAEIQNVCRIKALTSDNGGEYKNRDFNQYLDNCGNQRQLTAPHTLQQNGAAERANHKMVEMARFLLIDSGIDQKFLTKAIAT